MSVSGPCRAVHGSANETAAPEEAGRVINWQWGVSVLVAAGCLAASDPAWVQEHPAESGPRIEALVEMETTARLLALLLDSGRAVINEHQPPVDRSTERSPTTLDQAAGGSGAVLTAPAASAIPVPAGEFEAELIETFRSR